MPGNVTVAMYSSLNSWSQRFSLTPFVLFCFSFGKSLGENGYIRMRMYLVHCVQFYFSFGTSLGENII